jgi:DNA-binding CsgD family transcriptional regulator
MTLITTTNAFPAPRVRTAECHGDVPVVPATRIRRQHTTRTDRRRRLVDPDRQRLGRFRVAGPVGCEYVSCVGTVAPVRPPLTQAELVQLRKVQGWHVQVTYVSHYLGSASGGPPVTLSCCSPFERARTQLCFGERLRRARRNTAARIALKSALDTFEQLGAAPWADRARRELEPRRATSSRGPTAVLTTHERQVASLVGRGATNKEAAATLFVSPKTIDYHLSSIYRKLDIRSQTELALLLTQQQR